MGSYFKPLRRKFGVVTLTLTCLFAALWIRSFIVADHVSIPTGNLALESIISANGSFLWWGMTFPESDGSQLNPRWATVAASEARKFLEDPAISWRWRWNGWAAIEHINPQLQMSGLLIPFWSIVIPLTLLAASLLLTNPKNPIQTRPEPDSGIGA